MPCRDRSLDDTSSGITVEKESYLRAFWAFDCQRKKPEQTLKITLSEHINRSEFRLKLLIWITAGCGCDLDVKATTRDLWREIDG